MKWDSSYIIVRPIQDFLLSVLHTTNTLRDARYCLQHVAREDDAIFITPLHAQYKGDGNPVYMCHVEVKGRAEFNETAWTRSVFPECEVKKYSFLKESMGKDMANMNEKHFSETQVIELVSKTGSPVQLDLTQLQTLLELNSKELEIILSEPAKWINWESAMTLMLQDVYIISVNPQSQWPLTVTMRSDQSAGSEMNYDSDMKFIVRPRA
jgi:hypothetical protein